MHILLKYLIALKYLIYRYVIKFNNNKGLLYAVKIANIAEIILLLFLLKMKEKKQRYSYLSEL